MRMLAVAFNVKSLKVVSPNSEVVGQLNNGLICFQTCSDRRGAGHVG